MSRKILYLVNPISGTQEKQSLESLLKRQTERRQIDYDIAPTNARGDYHYLAKKIERENITDIVICGGDGTVNQVISALLTVRVNIGIVPMGSGNGLAFAAKIPPQAGRALELVFSGQASPVDGFYINDHFSCMLCGIGFDAQVAHEFAKQKRRGLQTYIKVALIQFFKAKPYHFEIQVNGQTIDTQAFFLSIANSNQFGNNFTIAPQASLSDGLLDLVIVKKMSKFVLPFSVISQVTGINNVQHPHEYAGNKNIVYLQTDSLKIKNHDRAPLHIDGDPGLTSDEFKIKIRKNCFRLFQP